jgi:hypothetical protein
MSVVAGFQQAMAEGDAAVRRYVQQMPSSGDLSIGRGVGVRVGNDTVTLRNNSLAALPAVISIGGRWMLRQCLPPGKPDCVIGRTRDSSIGRRKSGVDVHVQLIEARRVSGRVTARNAPLTGMGLLLVPYDAATLRTSPATLFDMPGAVTDANGEFSFVGISPGRYLLRAVQPSLQAPCRCCGTSRT